MQRWTGRIREIARKVLEEGRVDVFIGYREGTVPMIRQPVAIRDPGEAAELIWDSHCALNLCRYVNRRSGRIGVVAAGCHSRNLVTHIVENQIRREQLYVVGIPCEGMIDHRKVARAVGYRSIVDFEEEDNGFRVRGPDFEETFEKAPFLQQNCRRCTHRNPVIHDVLVAEPVEEHPQEDMFRDVKKIEAMSAQQRWAFFTRTISRCIRCYACRNVCPLCYCPTCFVDESRPQWVGKSVDPTDTMTFHILRAYHCAGRCTDCGACERVCPLGIPVRQFTRKLNQEVQDRFGWEAGLTLNARPPLDVYRPDDDDSFIR